MRFEYRVVGLTVSVWLTHSTGDTKLGEFRFETLAEVELWQLTFNPSPMQVLISPSLVCG